LGNTARAEGAALAAVRGLVGLMWLQNVGWKLPTDFAILGRFVQRGIDSPVFPPYSWMLENVVQPVFVPFGWVVFWTEMALAAFLLVGLATRLWAAVGAVLSLSIGLTIANAEHEWGWSYWLMIAAHVAVVAAPAAGRTASLDALVRPWAAGVDRRWARGYVRWAS
jgi:thiosulfate dehydrogenase (quinone) large subunit